MAVLQPAHTAQPSRRAPSRPSPVRAVGVVAPAVVLVIGMVAAVNLAIPQLAAGDLHPTVSGTAWIVDSYTLVFACLLIPGGALGDRFGRRRGMLVGLSVFVAGTMIAALAPSAAVLMAGRALSGAGAALVLPSTLAVALAQLAPSDRPAAVALWSALSGVAGAVGNLGGGLAVELGGWRALFWGAVPIALAALALVAAYVPAQTPHRDPVDGGGALLLTAGMVLLLYGVIDAPQLGWGSWPVLGALAGAAIVLGAFVAYEVRAAHPMLDPRLFGRPGVRAGALGIVALFFVLFGLFYVNAQYLHDVKGLSPLITGVCILPLAVPIPFASPRSARIAARFGARPTLVIALLAVAGGLVGLSCATVATPYALYALLLAVVGAGTGLAMPPLSGMMVHALPPTHAGVGAGLNSTTRELGSALGVAVVSTALTTRFASHLPPPLHSARHSVATALHQAAGSPSLIHATRDAFTSGTSLGLRIGAGLLLATTAVVAHQHPKEG